MTNSKISQEIPIGEGVVTIMDTTLRDGEQTSGVSFSEGEKLSIARILLEDVRVNRIEIASARVSDGEFKGTQKVMQWAASRGHLDKVEVLGFVDGKISLQWIASAGGKILNLLCKGSFRHVTEQLGKTPEQHVADIKEVLGFAEEMGVGVNIYLEDWSNGMKKSKDYVHFMIESLKDENVKRFMLPDTLGVLAPDEAYRFCKEMVESYPDVEFDFHAHNDYDLAIANVFHAIKAGIRCIHTTINGLGERAGNAPLSSVIATIKDHLHLKTNVNEGQLNKVSKLVESFSGIRIPTNKPLIGEFVFTQCSGIHADGDNKNNLYFNELLPERFGRIRQYALGKTSGKANIKNNLKELGIELDANSLKMVTDRIIELADDKEIITNEDLPYIVSDVLHSEIIDQKVRVINYSITYTMGLKPVANVALEIDGKEYEEYCDGDGQYDAFVKALRKIYAKLDKSFPKLIDYVVTIPPGGKTDALVETVITWQNEREFKTKGLDPDQTSAAVKATIRMLNIIEDEINMEMLGKTQGK